MAIMSTKKRRKQSLAELNQMARDAGNMTILLVAAIAERIGLTATEFECCSLIQEHGPFTAGELARHCRLTTGGMTGMIDRLQKAGFVRRETDPDDRRRVLVRAVNNRAARKKVVAMYKPLQRMFDVLHASYTDEQLDFLVGHNRDLVRILQETIQRLPEK